MKNKTRNLKRHLKQFPNDAAATEALAKVASAKPRKEPARMKARLDNWVALNEKGEYTGNRSRNLLNGRLSPWGKFTQEAARFSKAVQNARLNDPKKVLYLHNQEPVNPQQLWDGWAAYEANGHRPVQENRPQKQKHRKKK